MLINFFYTLKKANVPVSIRELLDLLNAMENNLAFGSIDDFYLLARTVMVKDEKYYDRFDKAFGAYFKNLENIEGIVEALIPEDWMRKEFEKHFTDEEKVKIESLGGLEKLIEEFKKRLEEQQKRHEGGNKWVGTNGTSPFGHGCSWPRAAPSSCADPPRWTTRPFITRDCSRVGSSARYSSPPMERSFVRS